MGEPISDNRLIFEYRNCFGTGRDCDLCNFKSTNPKDNACRTRLLKEMARRYIKAFEGNK